MQNKLLAYLLIIAVFLTLFTNVAFTENNYDYIYLTANNFAKNIGGWTLQNKYDNTVNSVNLMGGVNGQIAKPDAGSLFSIKNSGDYYVWAHTKDYDYKRGIRTFQIKVNGKLLSYKFGKNGLSEWGWENGGKISLNCGKGEVTLCDISGNNPRVDLIVLTTNPDFKPSDNSATLAEQAETYKPVDYSAAATATPPPDTAEPSADLLDTSMNYNKEKDYMFITAADFKSLGTWTIMDGYEGAYGGKTLLGATDGVAAQTKPAGIGVNIKEEGDYYLWIHTRDFASGQGTRRFTASLNYSEVGHIFGAHGTDGFDWEVGTPIFLNKGINDLVLTDISAIYPRADLFIITNDESFEPSNNTAKLKDGVTYFKASLTDMSGKYEVVKPTSKIPNKPGEASVFINNIEAEFDVKPVIYNGITMVPMLGIFTKLGAKANLISETNAIKVNYNGKLIEMTVNDKNAYINKVLSPLKQSPVMINGTIFVPLDFVCKALNNKLEWDSVTSTAYITYKSVSGDDLFLRPQSFRELGTWSTEFNYSKAFELTCFVGVKTSSGEKPNPKNTRPAVAVFNINDSGDYKVWIRSRDFSQNNPGSRFFNAAVNGVRLKKTFGQHGVEGFQWEDGGIVSLPAGENTFELVDSSAFYPRCDGIYLTKNIELVPPNNYDKILNKATLIQSVNETCSIPEYAKSSNEPVNTETIANENVKVDFYEVPTSSGNVIQRQTYIMYNDQWTVVDDRKDGIGYLCLYANESKYGGLNQQYPVFFQTIEKNGVRNSIQTSSIYQSGIPSWLIPSKMIKVSDNVVELTAENSFGKIKTTWTLNSGNSEPIVNCEFTADTAGAYSIGMFNTSEINSEDVYYALVPFKISSKRLPNEDVLINEQYAFTPMSTITLNNTSSFMSGQQMTYGIVVDPSSIAANRWVYADNSRFGMSIKGPNKGVLPGVFAPLFGNPECRFIAGQSFQFSYRPIAKASSWYDTYKHVAENIFGINDYRKNYYTSLNTAISNTRKLMMDDFYGGWDKHSFEHYNMEGRNTTSQANPMEAIQEFLFTEDQDILRRRTIPTIASLITRGSQHFTRGGSQVGTTSYFNLTSPGTIGKPIAGFNNSTLGGSYLMTRGLLPYLKSIGIDKGLIYTQTGTSVPQFSEYLWLYNFSKDESYLQKAKEGADAYIYNNLTIPKTNTYQHESFINISYYPNLASLVDIYETTGEKKYLDAAVQIAQMLVTSLWVPGMTNVSDKDTFTITAEQVNFRRFMDTQKTMWWMGDFQYRLGSSIGKLGKPENTYILRDETVPSWLPSRVGLGIEQASTYSESSNIIMSSWAPDLLRVAEYSGDSLFASCARNAIIGRFSNYCGYYENRLMVHQMQENYPYIGPDYTNIYYHHIPPFLSMIEDYLITQAWAWSDKKISFPNVRVQGYAYFGGRQYGHEAGRFFDEKDVWLWLKDDIVSTDNVQVDWLATRKEETLCLGFMNEDKSDVTTTVSLGPSVEGGSDFSGTAAVYSADGSKTEINVINGKFTITIPARKLLGVVIKIDGVKAPDYSNVSKESFESKSLGKTTAEMKNGKGIILQMTPGYYYAYTYITEKPDTVSKVVLNYKIGSGDWKKEENNIYPFEFITEVDDSKNDFTYYIDTYFKDGNKSSTAQYTLEPINKN